MFISRIGSQKPQIVCTLKSAASWGFVMNHISF